jgi:hypothetical protein
MRAHNRLAALHKHHADTDPQVISARAALAEAKLRRDILAADLDNDQRTRLAALLLGGAA